MRIFLFSLVLSVSLLSCAGVNLNESSYVHKITGTWERQGDASAGDVVRIEQTDADMPPVGILTKVSKHSELFGYKVGDIKWKFVRVQSKNTILIENLNATITREEGTGRIIKTIKSYGPFVATLSKEGILSINTLEKGPENRIGNIQVWHMMKEKE